MDLLSIYISYTWVVFEQPIDKADKNPATDLFLEIKSSTLCCAYIFTSFSKSNFKSYICELSRSNLASFDFDSY